jgi:hypothetical protein
LEHDSKQTINSNKGNVSAIVFPAITSSAVLKSVKKAGAIIPPNAPAIGREVFV